MKVVISILKTGFLLVCTGSVCKEGALNCRGSPATRLYNPLGGAYYRSYWYILLSRRRPLSGVYHLAISVFNCLWTISPCSRRIMY